MSDWDPITNSVTNPNIVVTNITIPGSSPVPGYVLSVNSTSTGVVWVAQTGGGGGGGGTGPTGATGPAPTGNPGQFIFLSGSGVAGAANVYQSLTSNSVGIGTTNPTANLHVVGNIYASNSVSTGNIFASRANIVSLNVQTLQGYGGNPVWTQPTSSTRAITSFQDENGQLSTVTGAAFSSISSGTSLVLTLASFTPTFSLSSSITVNWDVAISSSTGSIFSIQVNNPTSFPSAYISSVNSINSSTGSVPTLANWTASPVSPPYASGGGSGSQSFSLNSGQYIYTNSAAGTGTQGSASAYLLFNVVGGSSPYTPSPTQAFTVNWNAVVQTITLDNLGSIVFLQTFTSTTWRTSITGISNPGTVTSQSTTQTNGTGTITPSGLSATGTMTFGTPLFKDNIGTLTTSISFTVNYSRPANIIDGSSHAFSPGAVSSGSVNGSGSFTYPSFWLFKSTGVPVVGDVVSGATIISSTYQNNPALGDKQKTLAQYVTNPQAYTQTFWFGILATASQPTSFNSGSSPSLISSRTPTTATVALYPLSGTPTGWTTTNFNLYGFTLTSGQSYVSIS